MDVKSFNNELGLSQLQFARVFSGIKLSRTDKNNKSIIVPVILSTRSRIMKMLENPLTESSQISLPIICITRSGFTRDTERVANLNLELKMKGSKLDYNWLSPLPITITYTVTILAKYPNDLDEILSTLLVFFNSDVYVNLPHPKFSDETLPCRITWDGSVNEENPDTLSPTDYDIKTISTTFTFKTYLFGGENTISGDTDIIKLIKFGYTIPTGDNAPEHTGRVYTVPMLMTFDDYFYNLDNHRGLSSVTQPNDIEKMNLSAIVPSLSSMYGPDKSITTNSYAYYVNNIGEKDVADLYDND